MPLDLETVSEQIAAMTQELAIDSNPDRLAAARRQFFSQETAHIRERLDDPEKHVQWHTIGYPVEEFLTTRHVRPATPADFTVVAADGSSINPDRHSPLRFYLINTGYALLTYGRAPAAEMAATCRLFYREDEVFISPEYQTLPIDGALLAVQMAVAEMETLLLAASAAPEPQTVALRDGSLILWGLDSPGLSEEIRNRFLGPYLNALQTFAERRIPLASYVSFPAADDVLNALRVGMCPDLPHVICSRCQTLRETQRPACADLAMLEDRRLFDSHLATGERSVLFRSLQPVMKYYGHAQQILFFYVNVGGEIGRVEIPQWVADEPHLLDRVHALVVDQCSRGRGFPPALVEAHEQAVINLSDRALVERLIEEALAAQGVVYTRSFKDRSKRERGI